jgi:hypothetical protein
MAAVSRRVLAVTLAAAACHVSVRSQDTRNGETRTVAGTVASARPPTAQVEPDGRLRFVTPLTCTSVVETDVAGFDVEQVRPNAAAVVVGVVATALGAVAAVRGLSTDEPAGSPLTYVGAAGLAVGLPLHDRSVRRHSHRASPHRHPGRASTRPGGAVRRARGRGPPRRPLVERPPRRGRGR